MMKLVPATIHETDYLKHFGFILHPPLLHLEASTWWGAIGLSNTLTNLHLVIETLIADREVFEPM